MRNRLFMALGAYCVLALLVTMTLNGKVRLATLIFLAGLAARTYLRYLAER